MLLSKSGGSFPKDSISTTRVEGDHSNGYLARRFDHALFFVQNPASRYIAEGCSQALADANAMFDKPRFSWKICSDLEALAGGSHTGAARLALFFIGGTQARWRLSGEEASDVWRVACKNAEAGFG